MARTDLYFLHEGGGDFDARCRAACRLAGFFRAGRPRDALFGLAPRLTRFLSRAEWSAPKLGTLIFHPSALPYRRGPDAIRWTVNTGERVGAASWFWCDEGLDTGPICEQEPVVLLPGESPGRAYHTRFVPAGLRALLRALWGIRNGCPRREPQEEPAASYESFWKAG